MKYTKTLSLALLLSLGIVACNNEQQNPKTAEQQVAFSANLNLEADVRTDELMVEDLGEEQPKALVKVERNGSKVLAKFDAFGGQETVKVLVELRRSTATNNVFVGEGQAKVTAEKKISLAADVAFFGLGGATAANLGTNTSDWQMRLTIGGTWDKAAGTLNFNDVKQLCLHNGTSVDLSSYTGKLPFSSAWVTVNAEKTANGNLSFASPQTGNPAKFQPVVLSPLGNFLRIMIKNTHTTAIQFHKVKYESGRSTPQGNYKLGGERLLWQPGSQKTQSVSLNINKTLPKGSTEMITTFLWVAQVENLKSAITNVYADLTEQGTSLPKYTDVKLYSKTNGSAPDAKSTPLNVSAQKQIASQPISRMAPNYLHSSKGQITSGPFRFASTYNTSDKYTDDGTVGRYYSLSEAKTLSDRTSISVNGKNWHVATRDDIGGVFPLLDQQNLNELAKLKVYEATEILDLGNGTKTYKSYYYSDNAAPGIVYAVRFLNTDGSTTPYTAAFRYQRIGAWPVRWTQKHGDSYLTTTVRAIGSWAGGEKISHQMLVGTIAQSGYWSSNNGNDISRTLPARGRTKSPTNQTVTSNGHLLNFWRKKTSTQSESLDMYQVQDITNPSFAFFNSGGGTGSLGGVLGSIGLNILLFENR